MKRNVVQRCRLDCGGAGGVGAGPEGPGGLVAGLREDSPATGPSGNPCLDDGGTRSWERGRGQTLSQGLQESVALLSP